MDNNTFFIDAQEKIRNEWKSADGNNKMIYMKHNFLRNYFSANASNDTFMMNDIILSELAKLVNDKARAKDLVGIFNKFFPTHTLSTGISVKQLIYELSEGLSRSKLFAKAVAAEIIKYGGGMPHADGEPDTLNQAVTGVGALASVVSGLGSLFHGGSSNQAEVDAAKAAAAKALADKSAALAAAQGATSHVALYVGLAIFIAAGIGVAIYIIKKK